MCVLKKLKIKRRHLYTTKNTAGFLISYKVEFVFSTMSAKFAVLILLVFAFVHLGNIEIKDATSKLL